MSSQDVNQRTAEMGSEADSRNTLRNLIRGVKADKADHLLWAAGQVNGPGRTACRTSSLHQGQKEADGQQQREESESDDGKDIEHERRAITT